IEGRSFTERLELEVGGRFSHYSTAGDSWTWKAGGQWFPVENLRFRGMWQRAVRAPNIEEVLQAPSVFTEFVGGGDFCLAVNDPVGRGFSDVCIAQGMDPAQVGVYDIPPGVDIDDFEIPYDLVVRGNPNLEPERAGTITVGADYTFETPYHLQLGVDYFDIRLKGAIAFTGSNFDLCELIADPDSDSCTLITRDPTGFPISSIQQPLNLSVARVKGVDLNLRFSAAAPDFLAPEGGADIGIRSQATHYIEFGDALTTSTPFVDCAGGFSGSCGLTGPATTYPDKVVNTTFSYDATRWSASLRWRWISGQENLAPVFDELANLPPPNLPITSIGSRNYLDAAIRFDIADGVELRTGVDNILGTNPPLLADEQSQANTDPARYTVLGRRIFVRVEMRL
ncbi:MAG: TonB-dependent receptor, partial [Marinicaulis sp.]|nr:TonB-dependent receptor [Marinicaulis sp.]